MRCQLFRRACAVLGFGLVSYSLLSVDNSTYADNYLTPWALKYKENRQKTTRPPFGALFTADPAAHVFNGKLYVYTSTDNPAMCRNARFNPPSKFCMPGYRVFSTTDPKNPRAWRTNSGFWGVRMNNFLLSQWDLMRRQGRTDPGFSMWAPDVLKSGNRYYMLYPYRFQLYVAEATRPDGPFRPRPNPIMSGIDPGVINLAGRNFIIHRRSNGDFVINQFDHTLSKRVGKPNRLLRIQGLNPAYYTEGPFFYKRNGFLYLQIAVSRPGGYRLQLYRTKIPAHAPHKAVDQQFYPAGIAVGAMSTGGTNHGSMVRYKGTDYVFYHRHLNQPVNTGDKRTDRFKYRTVMYDRACYRANGTIKTEHVGHNALKKGCR